jgi:hypothetical protein
MRLRREGLKTGQLLACFPPDRQDRNSSILFLVEGAEDIGPLQAIEESLQGQLDDSFQWHTVANHLDLSAVDPRLDPERLMRLEAAEFRGLSRDTLGELLAPAVVRMKQGEKPRFPSASRIEGSVALGEDFLGREQELRELKERIQQCRHTLLVAPRRSGKTTLLYRLQAELDGVVRVELFDAQQRGSAQSFTAALWARATGQAFTAALKDVRGGSWQDFVLQALRQLAGEGSRPLALAFDELSMFLEQVKTASEGTELLAALDAAVTQVQATVLVAGSIDLRRLVKERPELKLPGLFSALETCFLPPLAEGRLDLYLRRVLLGTGLVPEPGDLDWMARNVDLGMPYPALQFLSHLASAAREQSLDAEVLESELRAYLQTTQAFRETESHLNRLAEEAPERAERVERVLERLTHREGPMPVADVKALLATDAEAQDGDFAWLVEHLPLRVNGDQVKLASRLFRRYWLARMERSR